MSHELLAVLLSVSATYALLFLAHSALLLEHRHRTRQSLQRAAAAAEATSIQLNFCTQGYLEAIERIRETAQRLDEEAFAIDCALGLRPLAPLRALHEPAFSAHWHRPITPFRMDAFMNAPRADPAARRRIELSKAEEAENKDP